MFSLNTKMAVSENNEIYGDHGENNPQQYSLTMTARNV